MFNFEKPTIAKKTPSTKSPEIMQPPFEILERGEALKYISNQYSLGERPVVTVPRKYIDFLKEGLRPYTTWVGVALIAATFGREPYESDDRVVVNVKNIPLEQIEPRFTGPNNSFSGVVVLNPPIPPEYIEYDI